MPERSRPRTAAKTRSGTATKTRSRIAAQTTVVVCTYTADRLELLRGLARSVAAGEKTPLELIVVVDRNPELRTLLEHEVDARREPWTLPTRVIASSGGGLSAARNTGWLAANTASVAFVDDDAVVGEDWLGELVSAMDGHDADVVGGAILPEWPRGEPAWYTDRLGWVVGCTYRGLPAEASVVRNVIGCNMLIRRSLLEELGGFDEDLGRVAGGLAGCEETELCIRATAAGAKVVWYPGAPVRQVLPRERATIRYALRRSWGEGRSKAMLRRIHADARGVLAPETTYARELVAEAAGRIASGLAHANGREIERAAVQLAVLGATGLSYLVHGVAAHRIAGVRPVQRPSGEHRDRTTGRSIAAHRST